LNRTANEANSNNNNTDKENIQNIQRKCTEQLSPPNASRASEPRLTWPASSPSQNPAWRHMVSNTHFCLAVLVQPPCCVPSWCLVKINPVLAEHKVVSHRNFTEDKVVLARQISW